MSDEPELDWNIELNFDAPAAKKEVAPVPPPPPKIPPREVLKEKFPRILDRVNLLWGTLDLHKYFKETLFNDRDKRQGFPPDVMEALGQLNSEHQQLLARSGIIRLDVWDMQFGEVISGKK